MTERHKPRFVAGVLDKSTASLSPDVNDPPWVNFDTLREAYFEERSRSWMAASDLLMIETVFDTLNAKAAIFVVEDARHAGNAPDHDLWHDHGRFRTNAVGPDDGGFRHSVRHAKPLSIGLNCALGPANSVPMSRRCRVSQMYAFPLTLNMACRTSSVSTIWARGHGVPWSASSQHQFLNIVGAVAAQRLDHIRAIADAVLQYEPRLSLK